MVRKRAHKKINAEINIVPLLDVLLVILLTFMITAPSITQNIEVDLPDAINFKTFAIDNNLPVIIEVSSIGQYSLIVNRNRMDNLPSEQVMLETHSLITANPKMTFLVGGAKDVPYDAIIKTLSLLHQAGVRSIGLMTQPI